MHSVLLKENIPAFFAGLDRADAEQIVALACVMKISRNGWSCKASSRIAFRTSGSDPECVIKQRSRTMSSRSLIMFSTYFKALRL